MNNEKLTQEQAEVLELRYNVFIDRVWGVYHRVSRDMVSGWEKIPDMWYAEIANHDCTTPIYYDVAL